MQTKCAIFTILAAFLVLVTNSSSQAVDTTAIDRVRSKEVLDSGDLQIIDDFVAEAVQELLETRDFTSIAKIRAAILGRKSSQAQYAEQFSESGYKYISAAFKEVSRVTPEERKFKLMINLLILVDNLENLRLVELAIPKLKDEKTVVRYWAVRSVTNPDVTGQLNSAEPANLRLAKKIAGQLKGLVENSSAEILALMAEFAAKVDMREAEDLLLQIVDMRMSRYADWSVDNELLDSLILKLLYEKIISANVSGPAIARRFGQLYSYAIQRYVKGRDYLNAEQKSELASVLVELESCCIWKILGVPQTTIKRAIEQGDYMTLLREHSRLLGDKTRGGQLPLKLNFDYGKSEDGSKRIAPLALPEPPKSKTPSKD